VTFLAPSSSMDNATPSRICLISLLPFLFVSLRLCFFFMFCGRSDNPPETPRYSLPYAKWWIFFFRFVELTSASHFFHKRSKAFFSLSSASRVNFSPPFFQAPLAKLSMHFLLVSIARLYLVMILPLISLPFFSAPRRARAP